MRRVAGLLPAVASGLLLFAAFPPLALSPIAFVALVPLCLSLEKTGGERPTARLFVFAMTFYSIGLYWLSAVITPVGVVLLAGVIWVLFILPMGIVTGFLQRRGWPLALLLPLGYVAADWCRTWLFTGFPWLYPGHTQADWTTLIQVSDVTGAWGLTAFVVFVNVAVADLVAAVRDGTPRRAIVPVATAAVLLSACLSYGTVRIGGITSEEGPRILVVQGNVAQGEKQEAWQKALDGPDVAIRILDRHLRLTADGVAEHPEVELVIWSETMFPYRIDDRKTVSTDRRRIIRANLSLISRAAGRRPVIFGSLYRTEDGEARNSVFHLDATGEILARYDKRLTVPGGEHIPFYSVMPDWYSEWLGGLISKYSGYVPDLTEGEAPTVMEAGGARFAPLICYEICYPEVVRSTLSLDPAVLLNLSNYAWYPDTHQQEQVEDITIFRAVENRRTVVVAANTGISSIIDARGVVGPIIGKEMEGVLAARVPVCRAASVHAVTGDLFAWLSAGVLVILTIAGLLRKKWRSGERADPT
jgi:apolipoprotein N-acyltransferase